MLTGLGRSQLEVQRCSLSSEGPRLRSAVPSALRPLQLKSSSAHCVRKLAKSLAKSWQGEDGERVGKAEVNLEVEAEVVEEKEEEKNNSG